MRRLAEENFVFDARAAYYAERDDAEILRASGAVAARLALWPEIYFLFAKFSASRDGRRRRRNGRRDIARHENEFTPIYAFATRCWLGA